MADADATESGVYAWMASVRASMDSDPSRRIFENQVQSHAFVFLDNYLQHILAGPKQGPIIELVKTPGRKRNIPRKTRAAVAAVESTIPFSLVDNNSSRKDIPVNSFHKALLQAKERSVQDTLSPQKYLLDSSSTSSGLAEKADRRSKSVQVAEIPEIIVATEPKSQTGLVPFQHRLREPQSESSMPLLSSGQGTGLSVIAEGDESPERSRTTIILSSTAPFSRSEPSQTAPQSRHETHEFPAAEENSQFIDHMSRGDPLQDPPYLASQPVDTVQRIPLDLPREMQSSEVPTDNYTMPLPSKTDIESPGNHERNVFTAPLPSVPVSNLTSNTRTDIAPLNDLSSKALPGFPVLPAPSPLRKSVRLTQDVLASSVTPATIPIPLPLGKRTSWLMKAREAKAMEVTSSSLPGSSVFAIPAPRVLTAVKRKSEEILDTGLHVDRDQRHPKVARSTEVDIAPLIVQETEEIIRHDCPVQGSPSVLPPVVLMDDSETHLMDVDKQNPRLNFAEEGLMGLFKRTVEGLGARGGKSIGKPLGDAAVAALAEARAAAEARVAERNKVHSEPDDSQSLRESGFPDQESLETQVQSDNHFTPALQAGHRLSFSDLALGAAQVKEPGFSSKTGQATGEGPRINSGDESVSTTPPDSPPLKGSSGFVKPAGPVFNKPPPPPVFIPPALKQHSITSEHTKDISSKFLSEQSKLPASVPLDIPTLLTSPSNGISPLAEGTSEIPTQSSQSNNNGVTPAWVLDTIDSQSYESRPATLAVDSDDDDDSWPLEEKLAAVEPGWRPFDFSNVDKEDTWSSLPTESQGPTRKLSAEIQGDAVSLPNDANLEGDTKDDEAGHSIFDGGEPDEVAVVGVGSLGSVDSELSARARSKISITSTASSSQIQGGFFSQASKLVNNMLGGGKKAKPELKSLQLAAAAAKRQQEETDKKTQRLKDMEARRQVATAKKAEEERTRLFEEQKKGKEESERRKREREENTDRRPLKPPVSTKKADDDASKKRKLAPEAEKRQESKKPPPKEKKDVAPPAKPAITPAAKLATSKGTKASTAALISSTTYNVTQNPLSAKPFTAAPSSKGKAKMKPQEENASNELPSTMVQSQMAARVKAQMQAAKVPAEEIPSESIELPEINSEYSDSDDEDRVRTFDLPEWAQSPELRQALEMQSTVNPDDVFGGIRPLRMEELFRTRQSRFRARTSSANWSGSDRLTVEEIREYERRMGFQQTHAS